MHPLSHGIKRVWLGTSRLLRDWCQEWEITPARFDMLTVIAEHQGSVMQSELRRTLAVAGPVVSRMLKSLENLGLVRRRPDPRDRRRRIVELTDAGWHHWSFPVRELTYPGHVEGLAAQIVSSDPYDRAGIKRWMAAIRPLIAHLRKVLEDTSTLRYPCFSTSGERIPRFAHPFTFNAALRRRFEPPDGEPLDESAFQFFVHI